MIGSGTRRSGHRLLALLLLFLAPSLSPAQEGPPTTAPESEGPLVKGSSVGYVDSAVPFTHLRLRYDTAYRNVRPSRAEFFYAKGAPGGPGLPVPDTRVDYQDFSAYFELAWSPCFSLFVESPVRLLNPEINPNTAGLGDMTAGFKFAFIDTPAWMATFQLKTYVPTGDADRGLGTNHVSLEPGLLFNHCLGEKLTLEGELRFWIPIGGTDFAGEVIRYGVGVSYGRRDPERFWLSPVVELVGWTVLDGKEAVAHSPTSFTVDDAAGDTIVNAKFGVRFGLGDRVDFYTGYGRALTGPTWYKDIYRVEVRMLF